MTETRDDRERRAGVQSTPELVGELLAGLQEPLLRGVPLGAAEAPFRELLRRTSTSSGSYIGWRMPEDFYMLFGQPVHAHSYDSRSEPKSEPKVRAGLEPKMGVVSWAPPEQPDPDEFDPATGSRVGPAMTNLVDSSEIEQIVGIKRHPTRHYARAVSVEQTVYILHSGRCREMTSDLRDCLFSRALDRGIDEAAWSGVEDQAVRVTLNRDGRLIPVRPGRLSYKAELEACADSGSDSSQPTVEPALSDPAEGPAEGLAEGPEPTAEDSEESTEEAVEEGLKERLESLEERLEEDSGVPEDEGLTLGEAVSRWVRGRKPLR